MKTVTPETVVRTRQEIDNMSPADIIALQERACANQAALFQFVLFIGEKELSRDAARFALFIALNIWRMFEQESLKPLPEISPDEIMDAYENRQEWIESFLDADDEEIERWLCITTEIPQENIARYLVELLMENSTVEEWGIDLADQDVGQLFWLLLSVIDALDAKFQDTVVKQV